MKLNLFTPLPPAKTDVAQCVARMLPALSARFDLTLWTDQERVDRRVGKLVRVRRFRASDMDWRELNYSDFTLYNVGNDVRFHASIMEVAFRFPGLIIMHDVCVHELAYATLERSPARRARYMELLKRCGADAVSDGRAFLDGRAALRDVAQRNPLAWWPLQGALGAISHNAPALRDALPDGLDIPLLAAPLPWLPRAEMAVPLRRTFTRGGKLEMLVCGFLNSPGRRLHEILDALSSFPRRDALRLHVAGHVKDAAALKERIRELGLAGCVRLHGYLSERRLRALMERSHLALNLRWPSSGEASGAQLRFWNHSLPTIVTRTGWYARQPENCLLWAAPERETDDLHRHWASALDDYDALAETGLRGRRFLEERHGAESFADALADFLPAVDAYRSRAFVGPLAGRAGLALGRLGIGADAGEMLAASAARAAASIAGIRGKIS